MLSSFLYNVKAHIKCGKEYPNIEEEFADAGVHLNLNYWFYSD